MDITQPIQAAPLSKKMFGMLKKDAGYQRPLEWAARKCKCLPEELEAALHIRNTDWASMKLDGFDDYIVETFKDIENISDPDKRVSNRIKMIKRFDDLLVNNENLTVEHTINII